MCGLLKQITRQGNSQMAKFSPQDFTITFGKHIVSTSVVTITLPEPKPQVPQRKFNLDTHYKIAGRTFAEYVTRRMIKDGIGFQAKTSYRDACTDLFSYIAAPIPENDGDFLTYCHELGHCKSRQYFASSSFYNATWSGKWTKERLVSEVNAWKWGIRYFKRLGYKLEEETTKIIQWSLEGYFGNAEDLGIAKKLSDEFEAYSGINTKVPEPKSDSNKIVETSLSSKICPKYSDKKSQNWKPWHDMKTEQIKNQWKNQR